MIHEILIHWELCWLISIHLPYFTTVKNIYFFFSRFSPIFINKHTFILTCDIFLPGLKHALIVIVYLSLLTFPSILSAPTLVRRSIPMSSTRHSSTPRWWNPCGISNPNGVPNSDFYIPKLNIQPIIIQVQIDKSYEDIFSGEFVSIMIWRPCNRLDGLTPSVKGSGPSGIVNISFEQTIVAKNGAKNILANAWFNIINIRLAHFFLRKLSVWPHYL